MTQKETVMERRATVTAAERTGLGAANVILIGVLLAAGAVLKFFVGSMFSVGMKPNFIIAMYCLAILLIRPTLKESAIIGLIAGAVCQFFPGTPYINFISELAGAVVMGVFTGFMAKGGKALVIPAAGTFFSTLASGFSFIGVMYLIFYSGANIKPAPLAVFMGIVFGTAAVNAVIVQMLYHPARLALGR